MTPRIAVLCWEENRPWVSALRQNACSVPWVEEPKGDVHRQIPGVEPDVVVVDLTRMPERGKAMVIDLTDGGLHVPVVAVSDRDSAFRGLKSRVSNLITATPANLVEAVKSALSSVGK